MSLKGSLKLTLFMPIIGPVVILLITKVLLFFGIDKEGIIKDIDFVMSVNCIGLVVFCIPYFIAVGINIHLINEYFERQAFKSVFFFPLRVIVLSEIGIFLVFFFIHGTKIITDIASYGEAYLYFALYELVLGTPWIILSLVIIYCLNRDALKNPA